MCGCRLHALAFIAWPQLCCELSLKWQITFIWNSPWTTRRPWAVLRTRVPGLLAAHTYTPECCTPTSEIIRFPVPSTWIPSTPMGRPSTYEIKQERGFRGRGKKNTENRAAKEKKREKVCTCNVCAHVGRGRWEEWRGVNAGCVWRYGSEWLWKAVDVVSPCRGLREVKDATFVVNCGIFSEDVTTAWSSIGPNTEEASEQGHSVCIYVTDLHEGVHQSSSCH